MGTLIMEPQVLPLRTDDRGIIRVSNTRVSLDSIVYSFQEGATPEEIVQSFDTLDLATVYAVVSFYLNHKQEVESYLKNQEQDADANRTAWAKQWPKHAEYRQQLLARIAAKEQPL